MIFASIYLMMCQIFVCWFTNINNSLKIQKHQKRINEDVNESPLKNEMENKNKINCLLKTTNCQTFC